MPTETHRHYDADGNLTGTTVVERESRIDDADRLDLLALMQHDAELCRCGFHPSIAEDESNVFRPVERKCPVCAGNAVTERMLQESDEKWSREHKDAAATVARPADGRHAYVRMLPPDQTNKA